MTWHHLSFTDRIRHFMIVMFIIFVTAAPFLLLGQAHAASKTWDGGCGADTTWSCANNWSDNIVPVAGDTVTFASSFTGNSTVDSAVFAGTVTTMNIQAGYTGTITLSSSLTVSGTLTQSAGTFTAGSQTVTLGGLVIGGGTFNASSGTTSDSGALTITAGTFNANGGTMNFNGTSSAALSCNSVSFNLVTFKNTAGTKTVNSNCSMPLGNNPSFSGNFNGTVSLSGTFSGTGTLAADGLFLNATGSLSGFSGLTTTGGLNVSGTWNFGSYSTLTVSGSFTLNSGAVFTAPSGTFSTGNSFTINSGATFNANGGTVNFNTANNGTITCNSATFNLVTFTQTGGTKTVSSGCSLPLGSNPNANSGGSITLSGTLSGSGTLTTKPPGGGGTLTLNTGSALSGFSGLSANALTVNGTYDFGSYTTFSVNSTFNLSSGASFIAPSGTFQQAGGTFTLSSTATFNANGGTINFSGGSSSIACGNQTLNLVTFNTLNTKTVGNDCNLPLGNNPNISGGNITLNGILSGSGTLTTVGTLILNSGSSLSGFSGLSTVALTIGGTYNFGSYSSFSASGAFILSSGASFTAPSGTATFNSNFTLNSGSTFSANGGTVNFHGTGAQTIACNNATFNLVIISSITNNTTVGSDCNLPLGNNPNASGGANILVSGVLSGSGTLTVNGASSGVLTLNASGSLSGFSGLIARSLTINGTQNFANYTTLTVNTNYNLNASSTFVAPIAGMSVVGNFTTNSGSTFTAPSSTLNIGGSLTLNSSGNFNANSGTLNLNGGGTATCNNAVFNFVTISQTSTLNITNGCNFPMGNNPHIHGIGNLVLAGTISGSGTFFYKDGSSDTGLMRIDDGYLLSGFSGLNAGVSLVVHTTGTANFSTFTTLIVGSQFIDNTSASGGNFAIDNGGTFIAPPGTMTITGNFSNTSGTFSANGGTVQMLAGISNAPSGFATISGNNTFHNLSISPRGSGKITFAAGTTQTITGTLSLTGSVSYPLYMISDTPGSPWYLSLAADDKSSYLNPSDSHVLGATITACDSTDGGGNSGWVFNAGSCSTGGTTAVSNFQALQSYLSGTQAQQEQGAAAAAAAAAAGSGSLPSKLQSFVKQFPHGKALMKAAGEFLLTLLIGGLVLGGAFVFFLLWRRRKHEEEPPADYTPLPLTLTDVHLPVNKAVPGTTVRPAPPSPPPASQHAHHYSSTTKHEGWPRT